MPTRTLPSLDDIEFISERTDDFLGDLVDSHQNNILSAIEKLEKRIIDSLTRLEANPEGRLEGLKVNMKQAQAVHKQMVNAFAQEYGVPVERLIGEFSTITDFVEESYSYLGEATKFTSVNRETLETLQKGFADQYSRYGKEAEEKVTKAMYEAVIAGEPFSSLLTTVTGALLGHVDRAGRPMAMYAKQHAFDSVMNFNNQVNLAKTEQLGMKHFLYFGNIMGTTRPFCEIRAGNIYSKEQIEAWNDMPWAGKAGPPMIYRGGYNCRHHWRGVRPEWFGLEEGEDIPMDFMAEELAKKGELKRRAYILYEAGERDPKKILAALGPEGRPERVAAWLKAWGEGRSIPPARVIEKLKKVEKVAEKVVEKGVGKTVAGKLSRVEIGAIEEWIGVGDKTGDFDNLRFGNSKKAKSLRALTLSKDDPILKKAHYRGISLTPDQIESLDVGGEIDLNNISSFSRSEKLASQWADGASKLAQSVGIKDAQKVLIKVENGLEHGFDVSPWASALKGQSETISSGKLRILKISRNKDGFIIIEAEHIPASAKQAIAKVTPIIEKPAAATTGPLNVMPKALNITTKEISTADGKKVFKSMIVDNSGAERANTTWRVFESPGKKELYFQGVVCDIRDIDYGNSLAQYLYDVAKANDFTHITAETIREDIHNYMVKLAGSSKQKGKIFEWGLEKLEAPRFGLASNAPAEEWLKHRQKWEWCKTRDDIALQFKNKFRVNNIDVDMPNLSEEQIVEYLNEAGVAMADMWRKVPKVNDILMNAKPLERIVFVDTYTKAADYEWKAVLRDHEYFLKKTGHSPWGAKGPPREGRKDIGGFFWHNRGIGEPTLVTTIDIGPGSLSLGEFHVNNYGYAAIRDRFSVLRHEYGHYIQDHFRFSVRNEWSTLHDKFIKKNPYGPKVISNYALKNGNEFWAEFYSVISNPDVDLDLYYKKIMADTKDGMKPFIDQMKKHFDPVMRPLPANFKISKGIEKTKEIAKEVAEEIDVDSTVPRFGLPLEAKDADWLKHRQAWTPVDSLEDAKLQFKNKYNVKNFEIDIDSRIEQQAIRYCNELGETMADMYQKAPGLNGRLQKGAMLNEIKIFDNSQKTSKAAFELKSKYYDDCVRKNKRTLLNKRPTLGSQNNLLGFFWSQSAKGPTILATIDTSCQPGFHQLTRGAFKSVRDRWGTFRHEYGHFVQWSGDYTKTARWQLRFEELKRKSQRALEQVSDYGATKHGELWSEMFRVATLPGVDLDAWFDTVSKASKGKLDFFIEQIKEELQVVTRPMPGTRRFLIPPKKTGPGVDFKKAVTEEPLLDDLKKEIEKKVPAKTAVRREPKVDKPKDFKSEVKFEIDSTDIRDPYAVKEIEKITRVIKTEIETIQNKFPNIGELVNQEGRTLKVFYVDEDIYEDNLFSGSYSRLSHRINYTFDGVDFKTTKYIMDPMNKVVDRSPAGCLRHSLGQAVYGNMDQTYRSEWLDVLNDMKKRKAVRASYTAANGNQVQAFGEYFSVYTSPVYKRGDLPLRVEALFDDITGGRLKAAKPKLNSKARTLAACLL